MSHSVIYQCVDCDRRFPYDGFQRHLVGDDNTTGIDDAMRTDLKDVYDVVINSNTPSREVLAIRPFFKKIIDVSGVFTKTFSIKTPKTGVDERKIWIEDKTGNTEMNLMQYLFKNFGITGSIIKTTMKILFQYGHLSVPAAGSEIRSSFLTADAKQHLAAKLAKNKDVYSSNMIATYCFGPDGISTDKTKVTAAARLLFFTANDDPHTELINSALIESDAYRIYLLALFDNQDIPINVRRSKLKVGVFRVHYFFGNSDIKADAKVAVLRKILPHLTGKNKTIFEDKFNVVAFLQTRYRDDRSLGRILVDTIFDATTKIDAELMTFVEMLFLRGDNALFSIEDFVKFLTTDGALTAVCENPCDDLMSREFFVKMLRQIFIENKLKSLDDVCKILVFTDPKSFDPPQPPEYIRQSRGKYNFDPRAAGAIMAHKHTPNDVAKTVACLVLAQHEMLEKNVITNFNIDEKTKSRVGPIFVDIYRATPPYVGHYVGYFLYYAVMYGTSENVKTVLDVFYDGFYTFLMTKNLHEAYREYVSAYDYNLYTAFVTAKNIEANPELAKYVTEIIIRDGLKFGTDLIEKWAGVLSTEGVAYSGPIFQTLWNRIKTRVPPPDGTDSKISDNYNSFVAFLFKKVAPDNN